MINRILVPVDVRPVSKDELKKVPLRLTTYMDDRTVVPSGPSDAPPLDGKTTIPSHLPLDVLVNRTLVSRGMAVKPLEKLQRAPSAVTLEILDSRTVVPAQINPLTAEDIKDFERPVEMTSELREIVKPDIFTTGDANLLIEPEEKVGRKVGHGDARPFDPGAHRADYFPRLCSKDVSSSNAGGDRAESIADAVDLFAAVGGRADASGPEASPS